MRCGETIAKKLMDAGVTFMALSAGRTGTSRFLRDITLENKESSVVIECSINERSAFEAAFGAAFMGKKAVCFMDGAGLNAAFPAFLQAREKEFPGSLIVLCHEETGTESLQAVRGVGLTAELFKVPLFDVTSVEEALDTFTKAIDSSRKRKKPVIVRMAIDLESGDSHPTFERPGSCSLGDILRAVKPAFPDAVFLNDREPDFPAVARQTTGTFCSENFSIAIAGGFYDAHNQDGQDVPIVSVITGDALLGFSLPGLYDAVQKRKKFLLLVIDGGSLAGPPLSTWPKGEVDARHALSIQDVVRGMGVNFLRTVDFTDLRKVTESMEEGLAYIKIDDTPPAVVIVETKETARY